MRDLIIIDNSPSSYAFQPENGMPILSWYEDANDTKLYDLIPALKLMSQVDDIRPVITDCTSKDNVFNVEKAIKMCEKLLGGRKSEHTENSSPFKKEEESDSSYRESSTMGDACRITTEDGAGLDRDLKKMKAMTATMGEKAQERTKKMAHSKVSETRKASKPLALVNQWVDGNENSSKR